MNWMVLPYQRYFEFNGRSRRLEYWMFTLLQFLVAIALVFVAFGIAGRGSEEELLTTMYGLLGLFVLVSFIPTLAVQVRRFHDQNLTGWLVLLGFIPYVGGLIMLVFMCIPGTRGANRYGDDPKGAIDPTVFA